MASMIQFTLSSPTCSIRSSPSFACSPANPMIGISCITPQSSSTTTNTTTTKNVIKRTSYNCCRNSMVFTVRSSSSTDTDTVGPIATVGQVTEVSKDTFWPIVHSAGDKTVVLDMYTRWCGPCKLIAPKYEDLSRKYDDVVFLKLDCNQENKPLAKELGIKVVPTFKILKDGKIVQEVTGAKIDGLVLAIDTVISS